MEQSSTLTGHRSETSTSDKKSQPNLKSSTSKLLPPTTVRSVSRQSLPFDDQDVGGNPFHMPPDNLIFMLRDKERQRKKEERLRQRKLHVHEKTTYSSRVNFRPAAMVHRVLSDDGEDKEEDTDKASVIRDEQQLAISVTRDRHVEKESLSEYIAKKREMFLVQYSLGVKRDEMRKLEEIAQAEERKLELAEQFLEEDAAMFDEFLKENDKNSVEAIKVAEVEAKVKMEKAHEIKKLCTIMTAIRSEIAKYEETLKEYHSYKHFLDGLTPADIRTAVEQQRQQSREERKQKEQEKPTVTVTATASDAKQKKKCRSPRGRNSKRPSLTKKKTPTEKPDDSMDTSTDLLPTESQEDLVLYFTDPHQVLDIFSDLEEQCLSLIQNSQETEESLEEMKCLIRNTRKKMNKETKVLKEQIEKLHKNISREKTKAAELKMKIKMFATGDVKEDHQERGLQNIDQTVQEVYRSCVGDNEANISTVQMMTSIENFLEELFQIIETMPQERVVAAEKRKEKERRLKMREEKLEQQRLYQEERVRRALERAKAEPKRVTGKKLIYRSKPPELKKKKDDGSDQATREEQEYAYFFQW